MTHPTELKAGFGETVTVVFSYSHKDEKLRDELAAHLKILDRNGVITAWHDYLKDKAQQRQKPLLKPCLH
jgi:hypothetical protein